MHSLKEIIYTNMQSGAIFHLKQTCQSIGSFRFTGSSVNARPQTCTPLRDFAPSVSAVVLFRFIVFKRIILYIYCWHLTFIGFMWYRYLDDIIERWIKSSICCFNYGLDNHWDSCTNNTWHQYKNMDQIKFYVLLAPMSFPIVFLFWMD